METGESYKILLNGLINDKKRSGMCYYKYYRMQIFF